MKRGTREGFTAAWACLSACRPDRVWSLRRARLAYRACARRRGETCHPVRGRVASVCVSPWLDSKSLPCCRRRRGRAAPRIACGVRVESFAERGADHARSRASRQGGAGLRPTRTRAAGLVLRLWFALRFPVGRMLLGCAHWLGGRDAGQRARLLSERRSFTCGFPLTCGGRSRTRHPCPASRARRRRSALCADRRCAAPLRCAGRWCVSRTLRFPGVAGLLRFLPCAQCRAGGQATAPPNSATHCRQNGQCLRLHR